MDLTSIKLLVFPIPEGPDKIITFNSLSDIEISTFLYILISGSITDLINDISNFCNSKENEDAGLVDLFKNISGLARDSVLRTPSLLPILEEAGVVDSGYRGEVKVVLVNLSKNDMYIKKGMRIAQMVIQKIETPILEEVESLDGTKRNDGGFGSTGVK